MDRKRIEKLIDKMEQLTNEFSQDEINTSFYILTRVGEFQFNNYVDDVELDEIHTVIKQEESLFNDVINDEVREILNLVED